MKKVSTIIFLLLFFLFGCHFKDSKREVVFVSWGGSYQEAQSKAYLDEFAKDSGVVIKQVSYSGELPKIQEMVNSGKVQWDVVSVTQEMFSKGSKSDLYEHLDYTVIDTSNFIPGAIKTQGIAHLVFSTTMAFNTKYYKDHKRPNNWKDFWDIKGFPGARALKDGPVGNLEFALLADGVDSKSLYPLDVDRAFRKLSEIKPYIKVWWKEGQQPIQLVTSNEVQISTAYNGRILKAKHDGEPIDIEWTGGMLEPEYFIIPKGAQNKQLAMKLISYATMAQCQERLSAVVPYGPTNLAAFKTMPDSLIQELPDSKDNLKSQFLINGDWWADNYDSVLTKWINWKLKN